MSSPGLSTGKSVTILAVVVVCLSILWPKVFYPMLMVAFQSNEDGGTLPPLKPPRGGMAARLAQNGRSLPAPSSRGRVKTPVSSSFNFFMPIYTMCIILVFVFMIFKIMTRSKPDKNRPDFDRLSYNEHSQLGQQGRQRHAGGIGQNNNFECPKRNRKNLRDVFLNNTERILRTYGREKMVDALNVVVHEIAEYQRAIELSQRIEKEILDNEAKKKQSDSSTKQKAESEPAPEKELPDVPVAEPKDQAEPEDPDGEGEDSVSEDGTDSGDSESDSSIEEDAKPSLSSGSGTSTGSQKSSSPEPIEPSADAAELNDICRNSEGLEFIDHVTEIKPGDSLSCYDELIYGESVTSPMPAPEVGASKDYEQWQSISPEELFQATSLETKFFNDAGSNRNLRRRKRRALD